MPHHKLSLPRRMHSAAKIRHTLVSSYLTAGVGPFAKQFRGTTSSLLPISTPVHLSAPAADMHSLNLNLVTSNSLGTDAMLSEPTAPLPSATAPPLFSHARSGPGSLPFHDMAGAGVPATFGSAWPIANDVGDSYLAAGGSSSDGAGWAEAELSRGPQPVPRAGSSGGLDGGSHQQRGTGRRISKKKQESNKAAQQRYRCVAGRGEAGLRTRLPQDASYGGRAMNGGCCCCQRRPHEELSGLV